MRPRWRRESYTEEERLVTRTRMIQEVRHKAIRRARELVQTPGLLFLDTETSGLDADAEIIDIAVIDMAGAVLLDSLVKPTSGIPPEATAVHGITDADVVGASPWPDVYEGLREAVKGHRLAIYNSAYDLRMIRQTTELYPGLPPFAYRESVCIMRLFARCRGEWDARRKRFQWLKLTEAARESDVGVDGAHRALADCRMTREVLLHLADQDSTKEV